MKLKENERSVLATFPSSTKAQKAKEELEKAGIGEVQVDRNSLFGVEHDPEF